MADYSKQLDQLAPEARKRVESILKASLERELAAGVGIEGSDILSKKEFSKGWFFSRSRPVGLRPEEEMILENVAQLDDAAFTKFAERLATLKTIKNR
jgi:hypothetical protein